MSTGEYGSRQFVCFVFASSLFAAILLWNGGGGWTLSNSEKEKDGASSSFWHVRTAGWRSHGGAAPNEVTTGATSTSSSPVGRIPNVMIAGVQKGGTTSLAEYLERHDGVCQAQLLEGQHEPDFYYKEVHFFDLDSRHEKGLDFYSRHFDHCNDQPATSIILDSTPEYMLFPERIRQDYDAHGTAQMLQVIFSLRNPIAREISIYNHMAADNYRDHPPSWVHFLWKEEEGRIMTFEEYIQPVLENPETHAEKDLYYDLLVRWTHAFDRQQILLLSFDELVTNTTTALQRVHSFLKLPVNGPNDLQLPHENGKASHTHAQLDSKSVPCNIQQQLAVVLEPYNERLYAFLEDLPGTEWEQHPFPKFDMTCNPNLKVFVPPI